MVVTTQYDPHSEQTIVFRTVETVSKITEKEVEELPPLYDSIDPEAVERLFRQSETQQLKLIFQYCGYKIRVNATGTITVEVSNQ
ncbi:MULTISPECIES: HalOD1 output domain-containing protein [unclassified Natrinema]|uniref:HalOD1 output domain-containing protein n=1 Tax=unclassified Natrinema TaxID=2622230 RepID=UPI0011AEA37D|nr:MULTISPECIES: HalOD1 output domain-containing protein [unclassified Natrinema]